MQQVPFPAPDGAAFNCNLEMPKPPPSFWDECGQVAKYAYRDKPGPLALRCMAHKDIEVWAYADQG